MSSLAGSALSGASGDRRGRRFALATLPTDGPDAGEQVSLVAAVPLVGSAVEVPGMRRLDHVSRRLGVPWRRIAGAELLAVAQPAQVRLFGEVFAHGALPAAHLVVNDVFELDCTAPVRPADAK